MKYLSLEGLSYFYAKVKAFVKNDFVQKTDITTSAEVSDPNKVVGAPLGADLQKQINTLNSSLASVRTKLNTTFAIPASSSIDIQVYDGAMYLFITTHTIPDIRSLYAVWGGNGTQANDTQKPTVHALVPASYITYTVSNVSGKYNQITITNGRTYAVTLFIVTLNGNLPTLVS